MTENIGQTGAEFCSLRAREKVAAEHVRQFVGDHLRLGKHLEPIRHVLLAKKLKKTGGCCYP